MSRCTGDERKCLQRLAVGAIALVARSLDTEVYGEAKKTFLACSCLSRSSLNLVGHTELLVVFLQESLWTQGSKMESVKKGNTGLGQK